MTEAPRSYVSSTVMVVTGLGGGLALVGWLVFREGETAEMKQLRERSKDQLLAALSSAVEGNKNNEKLPRAETLAFNLSCAQQMGMKKEESDLVAKACALLKKAAEHELRHSLQLTLRSHNFPDEYSRYADGTRLKAALSLAQSCEKLFPRSRLASWLTFSSSRSGAVPLDQALLSEAQQALAETLERSQSGERKSGTMAVFRMALPSIPMHITAVCMGLVQFQYDHQVLNLLPEMFETAKTAGEPAVRMMVWEIISSLVIARMLEIGSETLSERATSAFCTKLHQALKASCIKQDMSFFDKQPSNLSSQLLGDVDMAKEAIFDYPFQVLTATSKVYGCASAIFRASPKLFLPCLVPIPVAMVLLGVFLAFFGNEGNTEGYHVDVLRQIRTVREHVMEHEEASNSDVREQEYNRTSQKRAFVQKCLMTTFISVIGAQVIGMHYFGCKMLLKGELAASSMQGLTLSALTLMGSVPGLAESLYQSTRIMVPIRRAAAILDSQPKIEQPFVGGEEDEEEEENETAEDDDEKKCGGFLLVPWEGIRRKVQLEGKISFENVVFNYPSAEEGATAALRGISFDANPGEQVAVVGGIGCGKSTVLKLIERLYDCDEGVVKIDDIPIKHYNLHKLRRSVAVVSQESVFIGRTIKEAISYGITPPPSDEVVKQACTDARAWDFIDLLPDGLHSPINCVNGVQLSAGQQQCLAIARAIVRRPTILLLDEATAALDGVSEGRVLEGLERLRNGGSVKTTITIAHRLQTVLGCDKILVVDSGRVVEQGTHKELLDMPIKRSEDESIISGNYRVLWETQMKGGTGTEKRVAELEKEVANLRKNLAMQGEHQQAQGGISAGLSLFSR